MVWNRLKPDTPIKLVHQYAVQLNWFVLTGWWCWLWMLWVIRSFHFKFSQTSALYKEAPNKILPTSLKNFFQSLSAKFPKTKYQKQNILPTMSKQSTKYIANRIWKREHMNISLTVVFTNTNIFSKLSCMMVKLPSGSKLLMHSRLT